MSIPLRPVSGSALLLASALLLVACDEKPPAAGRPDAAAPAQTTTRSTALAPGRWSGEVRGGYTGNQISFVVGEDGSRVEDIVFQGHWDCADGIESTTLGPTGVFPLQNGRLAIVSVEPEGGGATATRFDIQGQFRRDQAEGTLRININALGCDTGKLTWSATPAGG